MSTGNGASAPEWALPPRRAPLDVSSLSSSQRSQLLEAMHAQLQAVTTQVNALTAAQNDLAKEVTTRHRIEIDELRAWAVDQRRVFNELVPTVNGTRAGLAAFCSLGWRARLRWLVTGR